MPKSIDLSFIEENEVAKMCNGFHHTDEILCVMGETVKEQVKRHKFHFYLKVKL